MGLQSGVHAQLDHCRDDPHNQPAGEIFFGSTIDGSLEGFAPMDLRLCSGERQALGAGQISALSNGSVERRHPLVPGWQG